MCLIFSVSYVKSHQTLNEDIQKHHTVVLENLIFRGRVTLELLDSYIVEQHESYRMVVESWESVQGNKSSPLFA